MARGYNKITIIGNLGADPEMRHTPSGKAVCNLRVAVGRGGGRDGGEEQTDWFTVVLWEKQAETANEHLHKGSRILAEGRMQSRKYEAEGKTVTAWDLQAGMWMFMDSKKDDDDEAPRKSGSRRRDEDDEDEPVKRPVKKVARRDDDDEDDEPAPPKKKVARRDEEEEEDEEPAPPKRSSRYR